MSDYRSKRRLLLKPVRVDLRKVSGSAIALWATFGDLHDSAGLGINVERLQTACAAGTVIGVLMLVWEH